MRAARGDREQGEVRRHVPRQGTIHGERDQLPDMGIRQNHEVLKARFGMACLRGAMGGFRIVGVFLTRSSRSDNEEGPSKVLLDLGRASSWCDRGGVSIAPFRHSLMGFVSSSMASTISAVCASSSTISPEASLVSSSLTILACIFSSILTLKQNTSRLRTMRAKGT